MAIAAAFVTAAGSVLAGQAVGADPRASENYRMNVQNTPARGRDIPGLAVDPSNPLHVVAADNDTLNGQCDAHASFDGGVTWVSSHLTAPPAFPNPPCQPNPFDSGGYGHTNGSIAFGSGQNVYTTFSSKVGPPQRPEADSVAGPGDSVLVARSTDGGRTFGTGVVVINGDPSGQPAYYRPKLAVTPGLGGADKVYVSFWGVLIPQVPGHGGAQGGLGLRQAWAAVSNDGGTTFAPPVLVSLPPPAGNPTYGEQVREIGAPVAAPGGSAWFAWRNRDTPLPTTPPSPALPNPLVVARTTDGGATWTRSIVVASLVGGGHPEMARDASNGNLYVTFQNGTVYPHPTNPPPATANDQDIYLSRSTDGGVTWSAPVRVNDDPVGGQLQGAGIPQTQPFVTVAPNGRVDVVWHDRRHGYPGSTVVSGGIGHSSAARRGADFYMASSTTGGLTFSANRRVTDRTMNLDVGLEGRIGDSTWYGPASAPLGNDLLVAMQDSREGSFDNDNEDIYLSRVAMQPTDFQPVRHLTEATPASASVALARLAYPGGLETQGATPVSRPVVVNENEPGLALAASVLARDAWAPLLLSPAAALPAEEKAEVTRMGAVGAFLIGGTGSLSATVASDVAAAAPGIPGDPTATPPVPQTPPAITRLAGANPADTAGQIADVLDARTATQKTANAPAFPAVVIVNPASPEAGAAAGLAASRRLPILFVDQNAVPAETAAALARLAVTKTYVVGGPGAVSGGVMASLPNPTRLAGTDVQRTSEAVAAEARNQGTPANVVYVADAARPADAAVVGAAVARLGGTMLLTPGAKSAYYDSLQRLGLTNVADRFVVQLRQGAGRGYRTVASDGGVFAFGNATFQGSTGGTVLNQPVVGMAETPTGNGYWNVASDGGVFAFGDAPYLGSMGGTPLSKPVVGMTPTPSGRGYWLVASDGGIFAFGDAAFKGSTGALTLSQPVVGMAATPTGNGYWLVASDGGIFAFGDAAFKGSTGALTLSKPVVGMAATPSGNGYWLVASDGGIFAFGDAAFKGSTGGTPLNKPIVGMSASVTGGGYRLVASDGGIFAFGDATFHGSTGGLPLFRPMVGMAG